MKRSPPSIPRLLVLWTALAAVTGVLPPADAFAGDPPPGNVLILLADDMGVDMLGSYGMGSDLPPTPNLDTLAAGGVLFRNAWSNPTCSPTRATLLTGRYAFRTGMGVVLTPDGPSLPLDEVTLPEMLDLGTGGAWAKGAFGKWHVATDWIDPENGLPVDPLGGGFDNPNLQGWDWFEGSMYSLVCPQSLCNPAWWQGPTPYDYFNWEKVRNGQSQVINKYATTDEVNSALRWIREAPEPWICYVAFNAPHSPYQAPPAELNTSGLAPGSVPGPGEPKRPYYKAMIEALDTEIGRLFSDMAAIDATLLDRTTVIFAGDNGTPNEVTAPPFVPQHAKGTVFEGGVNVPFIVSGGLVTAPGTECKALVNLTDVFATVAEIAAVDLATTLPEVTLDSVSIVPYLSDPLQDSLRGYAFTEHFQPNVALPHCQTDLGMGGPGTASVSICGEQLFEGQSTDFTLRGVPPGALTWIVASRFLAPAPLLGGTLGPNPIEILLGPFPADGTGSITFPLPGGVGLGEEFDLYFQTLSQDPGQALGWTLSNTVHTEWPEENDRLHVAAVRTPGFKLIRVLIPNTSLTPLAYGPGEIELFYDLRTDTFEQNNLLEGPLSGPLQSIVDGLRLELDALLAPAP